MASNFCFFFSKKKGLSVEFTQKKWVLLLRLLQVNFWPNKGMVMSLFYGLSKKKAKVWANRFLVKVAVLRAHIFLSINSIFFLKLFNYFALFHAQIKTLYLTLTSTQAPLIFLFYNECMQL